MSTIEDGEKGTIPPTAPPSYNIAISSADTDTARTTSTINTDNARTIRFAKEHPAMSDNNSTHSASCLLGADDEPEVRRQTPFIRWARNTDRATRFILFMICLCVSWLMFVFYVATTSEQFICEHFPKLSGYLNNCPGLFLGNLCSKIPVLLSLACYSDDNMGARLILIAFGDLLALVVGPWMGTIVTWRPVSCEA